MTRVFVVGNIAIDERLRVKELPSQGASIHGVRMARDLGGKGANQAIILARAGLEVVLIAGVGIDAQGESIRKMVANEPIESRLVELRGQASDVSIVLTTSAGANTIITTNDCARALRPADVADRIGDATFGDWIILQGNLTFKTTRAVMEIARSHGLRIAFNPSPVEQAFADLFPLVNVLFVNEIEAREFTSSSGKDALNKLHRKGIGTVILTRGARSTLACINGNMITTQSVKAKAIDPTGAGDTFLSTAIGYAVSGSGRIDEHALTAAARAAALSVTRPGTLSSFPSNSELRTILSS